MTKNDGGPAFPGKKLVEKTVKFDEEIGGNVFVEKYKDVPGMTLRAYAAIKLRVPESGIDWLDAMIQRSRFDASERLRTLKEVREKMADLLTFTPGLSPVDLVAYVDRLIAETKEANA